MDLKNLDMEKAAEKGAFLHFEHPVNGEKLYAEDENGNPDHERPIGVTLVGTDSSAFRRKVSEIANRSMGKRQKSRTVERSDAEASELVAACTIGVHNIVIDGEVIKLKDMEHVYTKYRWMREQADEFIGDRRNFFMLA
mgnify:FL=1